MKVKETTQELCTEVSKSQAVRLLDVFFIAPFLAYVGFKANVLSQTEKVILFSIAGATLFYNGRNFLETKKGPSISA